MAIHSTELARLFAALSDPTRLAVIDRLAEGPASVGTLQAPFAMAGPSFLKHLGVLEEAGLVASEKQGRVRMVRLVPERLAPVQDWLAAHRRAWDDRLDRLGAFLEEDSE